MRQQDSSGLSKSQDRQPVEWLKSADIALKLGITPRHFRRSIRDSLLAQGVKTLNVGQSVHWHYPSVIAALQANGGAV